MDLRKNWKIIFIPQTIQGKAYLVGYLLFGFVDELFDFFKITENDQNFLNFVGMVTFFMLVEYLLICLVRIMLMKGDYIQLNSNPK